MFPRQYNVHRTKPQVLAALLRREEAAPVWPKDDLGAILRHQLATPIRADLQAAGLSSSGLPPCNPPIRTFGDLFAHPCPPLAYLEMTKVFAKRYIDRQHGSLPREIASVLYYGCILVAWVRHGRRITMLDRGGVRAGAEWALGQEWLTASLKSLFRQGMQLLSPRTRPST